ncbi:BTB/POZ protein [Rhizophagus clarus]|uniref:BTB/POZ protein n=1 Tax=Rhizophagus clarus TaxID=94130 RepID=A0A8H3QEQ8_9GLOM|nr:BTB/POZ protein [Rhizophagus clarus]
MIGNLMHGMILSSNKKKNDGSLTHIKLPNILPEIFQIILRYIYGGKILLEEYDPSDIIKILISANELNLQELIPYLQSFLIKNKKNWLEQNLSSIYQMSFENDSFSDLQKFCIELITKQPEKIFNSPDFTSISEKCLISIIENNDVHMSMVQIWDHVLKWGIAQNPELSSDPSNYSNEDFNVLGNTLQKCISFIKFTDFTPKEFLHKVYSYKKIIPEEMYENLIKYFLDHDCNQSEPQMIRGTSIQIESNSGSQIIRTSDQNNDIQKQGIPPKQRVNTRTSNQSDNNPEPEMLREQQVNTRTNNQNDNNAEPEVFRGQRINPRTSNQSVNKEMSRERRANTRTNNQNVNNPEPEVIRGQRVNARTSNQSDNNPELEVIRGQRVNTRTSNQNDNNPELEMFRGRQVNIRASNQNNRNPETDLSSILGRFLLSQKRVE